jgi:hypothetical protein
MFGHPFGAVEMAFVSLPGTFRLAFGIDVQHDPRDFSPICTFGVRIQQTKVRDCVFMIVGCQDGVRRRGIRDIGIEWGLLHGQPCIFRLKHLDRRILAI